MDKKRTYNTINRNRSLFNNLRSTLTRNNVVAPEILVSRVWMQDEEPNGVEIIELNSSNNSGSSDEQPVTYSQAWAGVNNERFLQIEDDYKVNKIARERRRSKNNENPFLARYGNYYYDEDNQPSHNGDCNDDVTDFHEVPFGRQMNCFTVINNHIINSDSSSEQDYGALGLMEPESYNTYWDHVYNEDRPKYDKTGEQRTIWIYSFKNKRLLSEDNYELVNIPGTEMLSTSSSSSSGDATKDIGDTRIGSPIPATYIPRLNLFLGQTLSTVAEMPELKQLEDSNDALNKQYITYLAERKESKKKQTNDVINWLALSPRERRRRFKITEVASNMGNDRETLHYMEGTNINAIDPDNKNISSKLHVNVQVHAVDEEISTIPDEFSINENNIEVVTGDTIYSIPMEKADETDVGEIRTNANVPHINLKTTVTKKSSITSPIQKLDSNNWIAVGEKETNNINYDLNYNKKYEEIEDKNDEEMDAVSKRLYAKSLKYVRAADWNSFKYITGSTDSLHLSISCSSMHERETCLQKIIRYIKCCR